MFCFLVLGAYADHPPRGPATRLGFQNGYYCPDDGVELQQSQPGSSSPRPYAHGLHGGPEREVRQPAQRPVEVQTVGRKLRRLDDAIYELNANTGLG